VFENRVLRTGCLRRLFDRKEEELTGGRRTFHKEELHDLCSLTNIMIRPWSGRKEDHVARMEKMRNANKL
jgi:hypothetical protein